MTASLLPMLAVAGKPFDAPDYLFEIKWDGVRALASVDRDGVRIWGRELSDYGQRYPELEETLRQLPDGTILDGEIVVLREGRADLPEVLSRHQLTSPSKLRLASRQCPATYVSFDLLQDHGRRMLDQPLVERRRRLTALVESVSSSRLQFSEGLVGSGSALFQQVIAAGHEGIVAKKLTSRYLPGRRHASWRKIKPSRIIPAVIIGYTTSRGRLRSLLVATPDSGKLAYAAEVTCGFDESQRRHIQHALATRKRPQPVVACSKPAHWVEPQLYCQVRFQHKTDRGRLRGASFAGLVER